MIIKQGDQRWIPIWMEVDGEAVTADTLSRILTVEATLNGVRKIWLPAGAEGAEEAEITFDGETGAFILPLTQAESFAMTEEETFLDLRIKYLDTDGRTWVDGTKPPIRITVDEAMSREVL